MKPWKRVGLCSAPTEPADFYDKPCIDSSGDIDQYFNVTPTASPSPQSIFNSQVSVRTASFVTIHWHSAPLSNWLDQVYYYNKVLDSVLISYCAVLISGGRVWGWSWKSVEECCHIQSV